jgi:hypothetical protein
MTRPILPGSGVPRGPEANEYRPPKRKKRRPRRPFAPPARSARLYVLIDPGKVHMFRFLLEAEDNLGIMTVVDRWRAALLLRFSPHQERRVRGFLESLGDILELTVLESFI